MQAANEALGGKLGGVAVIRPRDGAVQALAGLAVSAPQPPGSTFKIITTAAALDHKVATPDTTYPGADRGDAVGRQAAQRLDESCGGSLTQAFVESCNSVFAPLGAKVGARRLVAAAEGFGFNEKPRIPAALPNTMPRTSRTTSRSALRRSGRTATSRRRWGWRASAPRSPMTAAARGRA